MQNATYHFLVFRSALSMYDPSIPFAESMDFHLEPENQHHQPIEDWTSDFPNADDLDNGLFFYFDSLSCA